MDWLAAADWAGVNAKTCTWQSPVPEQITAPCADVGAGDEGTVAAEGDDADDAGDVEAPGPGCVAILWVKESLSGFPNITYLETIDPTN